MNPPARLFAALLCAVSFAAVAHSPAPVAPEVRAAPASSAARDLTLALLAASNQYNGAPAASKGQHLANVVSIAKARHDELVLTAQADPAEFMRAILPAELLAGLPAQAMPFMEKVADESGTLDVFHVDHTNPADDYYEHILTTAQNQTYSIHFATAAPALASGTRVRVRGVRLQNHIVVTSGSDVGVTKLSVLGNTLGAQKTLVILVNFSDAPASQPYTATQASSVVFSDTSNYDYAASYQQTTLTGTVAGWFTIAETSATCNYNNIASQAKQAATSAGYALANYNRYVYVFPSNTCSWWGLGSVGGSPSQAWIHTKWGLSLNVVGHEMGHNFGLYHSHSMDCGAAVIAASGCTTSEYGDAFDLMGNISAGHYNAYHKERLGWLNAGVSPPLITVPAGAAASYTISLLENSRDSLPRALKIPRGTACAATNEFFYVEARKNVAGGVVVHKVTDGAVDSSYLLDMTPATTSWSDAALLAGKTFVDPQTGLSITPTSVSATGGAQLSVAFGTGSCTRSSPTITVTPTGTVWTSAGATATYSVNVKNMDSCGCASTSFDVAGAALPTGWTSTSARSATIAPGATTSSSVLITTPAGAPPAISTFSLLASNTAGAGLTASAAATVGVSSAIAVTTSSNQTVYTLPKQGNAYLNVVLTANVTSSSSPVAAAAVSFAVKDPTGKTATLSASTDANGKAQVTYALRTKSAMLGPYVATASAKVGSMTASSAANFLIQK